MGFYLWMDRDVAWAQGTYEYRPMGAAVIAVSGCFESRDFHLRRRVEPSNAARFLGQFASLGHLNAELAEQRRRRYSCRSASTGSTSAALREGT